LNPLPNLDLILPNIECSSFVKADGVADTVDVRFNELVLIFDLDGVGAGCDGALATGGGGGGTDFFLNVEIPDVELLSILVVSSCCKLVEDVVCKGGGGGGTDNGNDGGKAEDSGEDIPGIANPGGTADGRAGGAGGGDGGEGDMGGVTIGVNALVSNRGIDGADGGFGIDGPLVTGIWLFACL
jgi:hypothetical protein